ncbi:catechol 2,3-dioxygenase-like lactoylglutathione lyase family enzyme [Microvirga flocculans]|uniref:Catechol 2,3-dioxygenase-like lactoylglutathione lyase family enzyme n=1 Tax=Microvirga flocculans TaxID=217168 RepID=A0A7W6N848_9HYPH|nr:VOC family protein [Microvirga flocculans]MBB4040828.1 catechol 2,3-dioxygenase-like lactoylglutathione lyase family enzyme [Microvirga flocculans]
MSRRIDHLVVAVQDLDQAGSFYQRLGFQVGGRNRHPWGTENRIVQFPGSFIELIALGEGAAIAPHQASAFSFGAFVRDYLRDREGLAMLVLDSQDAKADAALFAEKGIGAFEPFHFERTGRRPDGSETKVAFTLAFASLVQASKAGFFVCQQHYPENFWNPAFQVHDNQATRISSVTLSAPEPENLRAFLTAFTGLQPVSPDGDDLSFRLNESHLDVLTPDDAAESYGSIEAELDQPSFVAFAVRVEDIPGQAKRLDSAGIAYQHIGSRLIVPASAGFGVAIAFEPTQY